MTKVFSNEVFLYLVHLILFNAYFALGMPWMVVGFYGDVFPPARGTWYALPIRQCRVLGCIVSA